MFGILHTHRPDTERPSKASEEVISGTWGPWSNKSHGCRCYPTYSRGARVPPSAIATAGLVLTVGRAPIYRPLRRSKSEAL